MEPTIKIGDVIITKKCSQSELNVGDIISFKYGDTIITHRINSIENTPQGIRYITKGDNNNTVDTDKVEFSDIQGKYVNKIGLAGKLLIFLKSRTAMFLVVLLILILYIHEINVNRKLEARGRKRKRHNWEVSQSRAKQL